MIGEAVRPLELLLVEDDPGDVSLALEAMQGKLLNNTSVTYDGEEALAFLRRQPPFENAPRPDLILLDLKLPKKGGREVLAEIETDESLRQIPVVILTGSRSEQDLLQPCDLPGNYYLSKPVDPGQFLSIVTSMHEHWVSRVEPPPR